MTIELFPMASRDNRGIFEGFMDTKAVETLQKLRSKGLYDEIGSAINEGKESIILIAERGEEKRIVKIYKIETSKFEKMDSYLKGDPRFTRVPHSKRQLIYLWTRKEYANLKRAHESGVRCPEPLAFLNNVLIMEFIGSETPAQLLKDVDLDDPERTFNEISENYTRLYESGLVHADLSEYNILVEENVWFIDFGQAVLRAHPKSQEFLRRDVENIANFFRKKYRMNVDTDSLMKRIVD